MAKINSTIFKQETIKSWFSGVGTSVNNEVIQPFQNANSVISKYNLAIQHNSLTQQGWQRLLAQSDDSLKAYLTSIKGSTASMAGYNVSLQGNITGFTKVSSAIKQYNALGAVSLKEQQAFATAVSATNSKLGTYLIGLNGSTAGLRGYGVSLVASTAKTIGLTVATTALNAAMTMGISVIVTGLISAFTAWINKSEEITEKAQEAADKINSISESLKTNTETVENAKRRYAELAQEVENLGKITQSQGTLSNGEYEEFLDLSNQLAGIFPSLTKNYDENGNAILDLSGDVNTIVGSLDDLIQKEKELANQKIMEEFPDVFKGYAQDVSNAEQKVKSAQAEFDKINNAYQQLSRTGSAVQAFDLNLNGVFTNEDGEKVTTTMNEYTQALEDLGIAYKKTNIMLPNRFGGEDLSGYRIEATGDIDTAFTSKLETARENLQYAQQQLEGEKSSIDSYLNTWLQGEFSYVQIDDSGLQTAIQNMLFNFDFSNIPEKKRGDWNYVSEYLRRNILFEINKVQDDPVISKAISEVFTNVELTPDEKANYLQQIQNYFGEDNVITLSLQPQLEETETLQKQYDDAVTKFGENSQKILEKFFKDNSINDSSEIDYWNSVTKGAKTATEAVEMYNKAKQNDNETDISFSGIMSEVQALSAGLDQMDKIYADVYDKEDFDWSSILNNEDFTKEFGNMQNVTDEYKDAYENFIKTVSNSPDDLNACQSAFDDLATAYIYNSGVLDKVTEETKDATIAFLQQKGVANAEEVVIASLTAKKEALALKEQALAITKNGVTDKTRDEINALLDEAGASETARNWLFKLIAEEQVFNKQGLDVSDKIKKLEELAKAYGSTAAAAAMSARLTYMKEQAEKSHIAFNPTAADIADLQEEINGAVFKPTEVNYVGGSATQSAKGSSGSKDSNKPSEVTKPFDWIENYLKAFARRTEKTMNQISDYLSFKKNLSTIKSAIKSVRSELSANEQALAEYAKQMNAIGLDAKYVEKIKNGALEIETITGYETDGNKDANAQLIEKIEKYQDLYDKYTDIEDTIEDLRETEKEWLVKNLEYVNEYYQKLSDIKSLAIDKKQDNIDLKEAQGKKVTTSDYKKLVSNNSAYIKSLRTTYKKTNAEFNKLVKNGTIEKNSAEWFEWKETLADLNSEIVQAKINTAEWKDEINQIKIDSYTNSLDRLKAKYDKLNTTISRKEASNIVVTQSDYNKVIKNLDQQIEKNNKLLSLYKQLQSQTQKNSEKWLEYQELIEQTESTVESLRDSIIETGQKMADVIAKIKDLRLEDNQNKSNLLSAKYDNATTASDKNKILDEQDALAKSNLEINNKAYKDYTARANQLGKEFNQYISNATKGVAQSNTLITDTSKSLQKERESYNSYANAYAIAQDKYAKAKTKEEKASAKVEMKNLSILMDESAKKVKDLESALTSYNTGLTENQSILSQLDGYEFGKEIDLSQITDEDLLKKAAQYNETLKQQKQALIDAGLSDQEAIKVLRENASQRIQNCLDEYEALDKLNKAQRDNINSKIALNKKQGYTISDGEYDTYIKSSQESVKLAQQALADAQAEFDKNLASGVYKDNEELYLKDKATLESAKSALYELWSDSESMLDEIMQLRIDALTEEKEALQKLYDLQQRRYKLEEAQYNLEKAKQRTNLVYNGKEFIFKADTNALKEAEKALEEAKYNELINKIDDWIKAMEDAKEDFNLYDADGNPLGNKEDIINAISQFGDNLLDGLTKFLAHNGWEYSDGEFTKVQTFADGGVVGKSQDSKFDEIAKSLGEDKLVAVKDGEMILTKMQGDELYKQLVNNAPVPRMDLKPIIPDNLVKVNTAPISVDMSGMQFHEVQNIDQFTKEIQKMAQKASSMIDMELGKRKM